MTAINIWTFTTIFLLLWFYIEPEVGAIALSIPLTFARVVMMAWYLLATHPVVLLCSVKYFRWIAVWYYNQLYEELLRWYPELADDQEFM